MNRRDTEQADRALVELFSRAEDRRCEVRDQGPGAGGDPELLARIYAVLHANDPTVGAHVVRQALTQRLFRQGIGSPFFEERNAYLDRPDDIGQLFSAAVAAHPAEDIT